MKTLKQTVIFLSVLIALPKAVPAGELPTAPPEEVGLSGPKLEEVKKVIQGLVDQKEFAGAVTMVVCRGKVVQVNSIGMMDIEAGKPMKPDTIFRIYSMTKPLTTVAAMVLYEEGKFQLDDPVSKYIPELKGLRVQAGKGSDTVEAKREMTIRDLMRHTSGLTYGFFGSTAVDKLYQERKVLDPDSNLQEMVTKLGKIPLLSQPGTRWQYSVSTDVLGRLVEVLSGQSLDVFFEERIFKPLDMKDSGFFVPEGKLERFSANYGRGEKGALKASDVPAKSNYLKRPKLLSGGGGLVSTARDYTRFCQMLLDGGELQGTRLLKKETVQLMSGNQLPEEAMPLSMPGVQLPTKGLGFGLGFGVRLESAQPESTGIVGEYYWGGAASTNFCICPKHDLVIVAMTQFMPFTSKLGDAVKKAVYESVVDKAAAEKPEPKPPALPDKAADIKTLLKERHDSRKRIVTILLEHAKLGRVDWQSLYQAQRESVQATLDLADSPEARIAALKEQLKLVEDFAKITQVGFERGLVSQVDALRAKTAVLDARIELLREELKAKPGK